MIDYRMALQGTIQLIGISSGSQQLTSGFSGANIGMASAQLGGKVLKHLDKAYF
jgi:hypothetical protein